MRSPSRPSTLNAHLVARLVLAIFIVGAAALARPCVARADEPAKPVEPIATSAPSVPPPRREPPPKKPVWPTATLAAVGVTGIGVGIALQVVAAEKLVPVEGTPCPGGEKTCPQAVKDAVDAHNALSAGGLGSFIAGSVSLAAMVVYVLLPWAPAPSPHAARAAIVPWAAPRAGGLVVGGAF
jgi:hypothetical protein